MRKGFLHTLIVCLILAVSVGFGFLFDFMLTRSEYRKYPQDYAEEVSEYADLCGIPRSLLYAVIHTESGFAASLASEDGAVGLMQITKETYGKICDLLPDGATTDPAVLYDPEVNVKSGAYWLQYLYIRYGSWDTALAAYRVGTDTVDAWLADETLTDKDGALVKIPDAEVTSYLSRIQKTRAVYERLYGL